MRDKSDLNKQNKVSDNSKTYNSPELDKRSIAEIIHNYSRDSRVISSFKNKAKTLNIEDLRNLLDRLFSLYVKFEYSSILEYEKENIYKFKEYQFFIYYRTFKLSQNRGYLIFMSNTIEVVYEKSNGDSFGNNRHIILHLTSEKDVNWYIVESRPFLNKKFLYQIHENGVEEPLRELKSAAWVPIYDLLDEMIKPLNEKSLTPDLIKSKSINYMMKFFEDSKGELDLSNLNHKYQLQKSLNNLAEELTKIFQEEADGLDENLVEISVISGLSHVKKIIFNESEH